MSIYKKLRMKYTPEEIADAFIFPPKKQTKKQKEFEDKVISNHIKERVALMSEEEKEHTKQLGEQFKQEDEMEKKTTAEQLGYNYIFHFNEYEELWYCIHKDSYSNYKGRANYGLHPNHWTSGKTIEQAAEKMLKIDKAITSLTQYDVELKTTIEKVKVKNKSIKKKIIRLS